MKLEDEIHQKTFKDVFMKAQINVMFTAAWLDQRTSGAL